MLRLFTVLAAVTLLTVAATQSVRAQITPADSAAVLLQAAESFEAQGDSDVARAIYDFILQRFAGTPAATAAQERMYGFRAEGTRGSGRVELQVWTTLYGLWLGVAIPGAFGADESEPYGLGLILGGPAGFFGGRALAGSRDLTEGQARAITFGGLWGGWQGFGWQEALDIGVEEICEPAPWDSAREHCYTTEDSSEEVFAATIIGSLAGMAVGNVLSQRTISPGVATTVNFGALWGTWFGVATGVLTDLEDDDLLGATLVGGNVGLLSMMALAPGWNVSRSRARLVSIAGVIGGLTGAGIDLLADVDDDKTAIGIPLATSLVGLGIGLAATRGYEDHRVEAPGNGGLLDGSLLSLSDGRWSVNPPVPYPVMLERDGPVGPTRTPGLGVTLLNARFR